MGFVDIIIYVGIALMYNLLIHNLASISYKDLQYDEKHQNTIIMLILFGGIGMLVSKIMMEKRFTKYKNNYVSKGLYYGGILLILTALFASWDSIAEEMKLFMVAGLFGILIWYGYQREEKIEKVKAEEGKINEQIINDYVKENGIKNE